MSSDIHQLDDDVISKIAAGEVVERPASVVKELVENSIDAGASFVEISVRGAGKRQIAVSDDGVGISKGSIELAFKRHTTSKIENEDDLSRITTMGFRGEALAAIAAVSRVEAITRTEDSETGTYAFFEGGRLVDKKEVGAPVGTTIKVLNLFYSTPARAKFLKSNHTELSHIIEWVTNEALAHPEVRFKLTHDGNVLIGTTGDGNLLHTILMLFGRDTAVNSVKVDGSDPTWNEVKRIYGYVGKTSIKRTTPRMLRFFVNRRPVRSTELQNAVLDAYGNLLPRGYYPFGVIFIDIDPAFVDVNIHPAKTEIKFRHTKRVEKAVEDTVHSALSSEVLTVVPKKPRSMKKEESKENKLAVEHNTTDTQTQHSMQVVQRDAEGQSDLGSFGLDSDDTEQVKAIARFRGKQPEWDKKGVVPELRLIGQLKSSYILCEVEEGLAIIDQHALHERIMYYTLKKNSERLETRSQTLLQPYIIELSSEVVTALKEYTDVLTSIGLGIEEFGPSAVKISAVPAVMEWSMKKEDIRSFLEELALTGRVSEEVDLREKIVRLMACKSAIKANTPLTWNQMISLLEQMKQVETPYACAHGRPTVIVIPTKMIEHDFERS